MKRFTTLAGVVFLVCTVGCGGESTPDKDAGTDAGHDAGYDAGQDLDALTAIVSGRVVDSAGAPVAEATVVIHSDPVEAVTDSDGAFEAEVEIGEHTLTVSKGGFTFHESTFQVPNENRVDLGTILPTQAYYQDRVTIHDHGYYGIKFNDYYTWCGFTVADEDGHPITGLTHEDVSATVSILRKADGFVEAEEEIPLAQQVADDYYDAGLVEKSVGPLKMDIVFIMDSTGSVGDEVPIQAEIHEFVDRLVAANIDFRIAGVGFDETPTHRSFRFHGPHELDLLHEAVSQVLITAGDWWSPTCAYEALLFTPWFGFRSDARRIVVVITDIIPQTIYGNFWYFTNSKATRSAAELFLEALDIDLYYALDPDEDTDIDSYYDNDINPRAGPVGNEHLGVEGSSFENLRWGEGRQAIALDWPLDQENLWNGLIHTEFPVLSSVYYLTFNPSFDWHDTVPGLSGHPEDYEYRVALEIEDPAEPGAVLAGSYTDPVRYDEAQAVINFIDEEGNPFTDAWADIYLLRGDRRDRRSGQLRPDEQGQLVYEDAPGTYLLVVTDQGVHPYSYSDYRAIGRQEFVLPPEGATVDVHVRIAEHESNEYMLMGLVQDLDNWRLSGDPYQKFSHAVASWLYECDDTDPRKGILCDGMNWQEQAAIRHLLTSLTGYANITEYAQVESQRAIDDFAFMLGQIGDVVYEINRLQKGIDLDWKQEIAGGMLKVLYGILSSGRIPALIEAVEKGVNKLIEYLSGEFFDELVGLAKEKLAERIGEDHVVIELIDIGIDSYKFFTTNQQDGKLDSDKLWELCEKLGLKIALLATRETINSQAIDRAYAEMELDDEFSYAIKELLQEIIDAALTEDGFDNFDQRMKWWAERVATHLWVHNRDEIRAKVSEIFDKLHAALEGKVPPMIQDFLLGFLRDIALETVPGIKNGKPSFKLDKKKVIRIAIKHSVFNLVLRDRFVDEIDNGLWSSLAIAQDFAIHGPPGVDRHDWEGHISDTTRDYNHIVEDLQTEAWNALSLQDAVDDWSQGLMALQSILEPLAHALDVVAYVYPPLENTADNVHRFALVLDTIQVVKTAIEFGFKVKCLKDFGDTAESMYEAAF